MLTLFAIPKSFRGHFNTIQRNAIQSWTKLQPQPEIILLGDDEGTAEVAREFGLKHVSEVKRNEFGTPLVSSLFEIAQRVGKGPLFSYINSDIVLMSDFIQAIRRVPFQRFMLTGQRLNLDVTEPIQFEENWETQLRDRAIQFGHLAGPHAMDYFVFTQNTYTDIPPFGIGRPCWDNWMLYKALSLRIPLIDATGAITAIHQNHDYSHHPQGREGVYEGPEAQYSLQLIGGRHYTYFMLDLATWQLTPNGLKRPRWTRERCDRYLDMMPLACPQMKVWASPLLRLLRKW
ncbi:MAG: hypothetical protein K6T90_11015 [Leptolyngbyaceae cyanobacterium HOT.MB2.61]|jgi:hypothetical protein|nr:hypothetical protein [Leptolyngbyaceae cyanobacterium HOT.MB2.61]